MTQREGLEGEIRRGFGKLLCAVGSHPCVTNSDDEGIWGECVRCHRRFGYVDRATLRRYADAEYEARARATLSEGAGKGEGE